MDDRTTRICRKIGDIFEQPENGWEDKVYMANIGGAVNRKFQLLATSNKLACLERMLEYQQAWQMPAPQCFNCRPSSMLTLALI
jgi:hypothetical protein